MPSVAAFRQRFCRRALGDFADDLEEFECEDVLGILRHRVRRMLEQMPQQGDRRPAFAYRAFFSIPGSPPRSRLQSRDGNIPFHFAKNEVRDRTAGEFDAYASRKEQGATTDDKGIAKAAERDAGIDSAGKDAYMQSHGGIDGAAPDHWTNLAAESRVRGEQWAAIEAFERSGRVNPDGNPTGLSIFYDRAPALFDDVAGQPACPPGLRIVIDRQRARVAKGRPLSERRARDGVRWIDERAFDVYAWITSRPDWPERVAIKKRPARASAGRAVQTHVAGESEYHASLDKAARGRIRTGMIELVQAQRNPTSPVGPEWFIPMTICDHVPNRLNDPLNDHFHWIFGTRLARFMPDGSLSFDDCKVDAITRKPWLNVMRRELARLTNIELERIGETVRYHPGTLAEMGIDAPAQQKMGGRRTVLERAGFSTELGLSNDMEGWRRAFTAARQDHDTALAAIERDHQPSTRSAMVAAVDLRYEAAQIQLLIDMSRSRADRTVRFAPEYAAAAASPRVVDGWLIRGREAEGYLRRLDVDLSPERDAVADRLASAARLEAWAIAEVNRSQTAETQQQPALPAKPAVDRNASHRAVDIIARTPLFISTVEQRFHIGPDDDPEGLIAGIDLSGVQKRLSGLHRVQERELVQVQAFARRHGGAALFDDACDTHTVWFRSTVRKWRDTPVMQRWLQAHDHAAAQSWEDDVACRIVRQKRQERELNDLPSLETLPSLDDASFYDEAAGYPDTQVTPEIVSRIDLPVPSAAPAIVPETATPSPKPPPVSTVASSSAPGWSEIERQHQFHVDRQAARSRVEIGRSIQTTLAQRTGGQHAITPYAARLLQRIEQGFDPLRESTKIGLTGRSLDQRDAAEIAVLSYEPYFRDHVAAAKCRDPGLSAMLVDAQRAKRPADFLGRVGIERGVLRFDPTVGLKGALRTPLEWAEETIQRIVKHGIPLTRHDGLVGMYDAEVLHLSHFNYPGLLHRSIQAALDVEQRIQTERKRAILTKVQAGMVKLETDIRLNRLSDRITTSVRLLDGTADERAFVFRRQFDAALYFECRTALMERTTPVPMRHDSAVVRAWLQARDDVASSSVLAALVEKVRVEHKSLTTSNMIARDAKALADILTPPAITQPHRLDRTVRGRPPIVPGRRDPGR